MNENKQTVNSPLLFLFKINSVYIYSNEHALNDLLEATINFALLRPLHHERLFLHQLAPPT